MTTLTISIIVVFVLGYALIATESLTKVNKAAIALLMLVGCWTLYMMDPMQYLQLMHPDYTGGAAGMVEKVTGIIQEHLGDTATTLFFLMFKQVMPEDLIRYGLIPEFVGRVPVVVTLDGLDENALLRISSGAEERTDQAVP